MTGTERLAKVLLKAAKKVSKPKSYSEAAEVLRVDNDTVWVHIPNGVEETPIKKTIACKKGDTVQVEIRKGGATLTGNITAPPTDDTEAIIGKTIAKMAQGTAKKADKAASEALAAFKILNVDFSLVPRIIGAGETKEITITPNTIPDGYQIIGVLELRTAAGIENQCNICGWRIIGNNLYITLHNDSESAKWADISVKLLLSNLI